MNSSSFSPSSPAAPGLIISNARLAFKDQLLFDDLNLDLPPGKITCLLGPSGVGKSSLLRLIAGLEHGAAGDVRADDDAPVSTRVAYMAQQDLLLPWLRLIDNVMLGGRLRGKPQSRDAAVEILRGLQLEPHMTKRPAELSGGMRQRAALARTLLEDRPIVLMDEPFSALDAVTRQELQVLTHKLLRGKTVLMVTHDPLEAARLADHLLVMTGRPVKLSEAAPVADPNARLTNDPAIFEKQAELLALLSGERGSS